MPNQPERTCATCLLCLRQDYGYSNWTVVGTEFHCLARLNPDLEDQEEQYGELSPRLAAALDVAKTCPEYRFGAPAALDVEEQDVKRENGRWDGPVVDVSVYTDDPEAQELLIAYLNGK